MPRNLFLPRWSNYLFGTRPMFGSAAGDVYMVMGVERPGGAFVIGHCPKNEPKVRYRTLTRASVACVEGDRACDYRKSLEAKSTRASASSGFTRPTTGRSFASLISWETEAATIDWASSFSVLTTTTSGCRRDLRSRDVLPEASRCVRAWCGPSLQT